MCSSIKTKLSFLSPIHNWRSGFHIGFFCLFVFFRPHFKNSITLLPSYQWHLLKMTTLTVITVRWSHSSSPFCCYSKCLFLTTGLNWIIISGWKFLPWQRAADSETTGSWMLHGHSHAGRFSTACKCLELQWVGLTKYCWQQSGSLLHSQTFNLMPDLFWSSFCILREEEAVWLPQFILFSCLESGVGFTWTDITIQKPA